MLCVTSKNWFGYVSPMHGHSFTSLPPPSHLHIYIFTWETVGSYPLHISSSPMVAPPIPLASPPSLKPKQSVLVVWNQFCHFVFLLGHPTRIWRSFLLPLYYNIGDGYHRCNGGHPNQRHHEHGTSLCMLSSLAIISFISSYRHPLTLGEPLTFPMLFSHSLLHIMCYRWV